MRVAYLQKILHLTSAHVFNVLSYFLTPLILIKLINGTYHLLRSFFISFFLSFFLFFFLVSCVRGGGQGEGGKNGENGVCENSVTLYQPVV